MKNSVRAVCVGLALLALPAVANAAETCTARAWGGDYFFSFSITNQDPLKGTTRWKDDKGVHTGQLPSGTYSNGRLEMAGDTGRYVLTRRGKTFVGSYTHFSIPQRSRPNITFHC